MNITCCICSELFVPSADVCFTPCGHFFHYHCVCHWMERSKTCPHCRKEVTQRTIRKAHFAFSNTDALELDCTLLASKIDDLNTQIKTKDKNVKLCEEENRNLRQQTEGLKALVRKLEVILGKHKSYCNFLNEDHLELESTSMTIINQSLTFEISLKDAKLKILQEDNDKLQQQTARLVTEVIKLKLDIEKQISINYACQEQIKYLNQQISYAAQPKNQFFH